MVRVSNFNPNAKLYEIIRQIPQRLMNRRAVTGNSGDRVRADHRADFFPVCGQIDDVRLIRAIGKRWAVGIARFEWAVPLSFIFHASEDNISVRRLDA